VAAFSCYFTSCAQEKHHRLSSNSKSSPPHKFRVGIIDCFKTLPIPVDTTKRITHASQTTYCPPPTCGPGTRRSQSKRRELVAWWIFFGLALRRRVVHVQCGKDGSSRGNKVWGNGNWGACWARRFSLGGRVVKLFFQLLVMALF
jgi:hypothetical protein